MSEFEDFKTDFSYCLKMLADHGDKDLAFRLVLEYAGGLEKALSRALFQTENAKQKVLNLWDARDVLKVHEDAIYAGKSFKLSDTERAKMVEFLEYCDRHEDTLRDFTR